MNLTNPEFLKIPEFMPPADLDCYQPPITAIISDWETKFENDAVEAVIRYGFDINKEELEKALNYDRGQYEKGYADARRKYERPTGEWMKEEYFRGHYYEYKCSICGVQITANTKYCPYCGAKMKGAEE